VSVPNKPGRLEGVLAKLFTRTARVRAVRDVAEGFRLLTLGGAALRDVVWTPGQKVQVLLGGWVNRTYTPMAWDAAQGTTEVLAYAHGAHPGSDWVRSLQPETECALFGPRGSLDLNALGRPAVLFGDETSFGLAHALRHTPRGGERVELVLEVTSLPAARAALDAVDVRGAVLVQRLPGDAHLAEVDEIVRQLQHAHANCHWVLSGKATSIARVTKLLRAQETPRRLIHTKAYWAPGKTGLD
jgi:ferric-chelate reductase (NADPH)